jgi:hypothetical protein
MARQLTETEDQLNIDSIGNGNTTTSITRPAFKFGKSKVGDVNLPQERTVDDGVGFVGFEPDLQRERIQTQSEIKVSGKYPEVNYVTFNLPDINLVEGVSGNVYSGVIKRVFPVENLEPTDTSTSGTSGTIGISGTNGTVGTFGLPTTNFLIPFGEPGTPGEIREFPPTGQLYIWNFNYNVGKWNIYNPPPPPTGGINDGSNIGNVGFDQSGGGGPVGAGNNLGGGPVTSGGGGPVGGGGGGSLLGGL